MNPEQVIVIGAGMGGLTAAIMLAKAGASVKLLEARSHAGGLASGFTSNGITFDAGPYILLDPGGLNWAFAQLGLNLNQEVEMQSLRDIYQVSDGDGDVVRFYSSLDETVDGIEEQWAGAGGRYQSFVRQMQSVYRDLSPMLSSPRPSPIRLIASGGRKHVPFLMKSLEEVLFEARLPRAVSDAISVWTQIAGQPKSESPSPLAFVPALIHLTGAHYPIGGMCEIAKVLAKYATDCGVDLQFNTRVTRIIVRDGMVKAIETSDGQTIPTRFVVSNCGGLFTYLMLVDSGLSRILRTKLNQMPLQSPGVCAYLSVKGKPVSPYLRFHVPGGRNFCRLLVRPSAIDCTTQGAEWQAARLIAPMAHHEAERLGRSGQAEFLSSILSEPWWRESITEFRLLATRTPTGWGHEFGLYRDSMNPVFNSESMRRGRMEHRSPYIKGLYLSGSSTHPGPWVSFCAISGILSARRLLKDVETRNSAKFIDDSFIGS